MFVAVTFNLTRLDPWGHALAELGFVVPRRLAAATAVDCYNQPPIFLRRRSPDRRVQVSRGELLGSLQVPFCRFALAHSNLSLFALK